MGKDTKGIVKGWIISYFEISNDHPIKSIDCIFTASSKELNFEMKDSDKCGQIQEYRLNGRYFDLQFKRISSMDSFQIEYHFDILHIEYHNKEPLILCQVPEIKDIEYIWNIDQQLLPRLKNINRRLDIYSSTFSNGCLVLHCRLKRGGGVWLGLELLSKPMDVTEYMVSVGYMSFVDNKRIVCDTVSTPALHLGSVLTQRLFDFDYLQDLDVLTFKVDVKVDNIVRAS